MLIINADDLGRNITATDNIISCWKSGIISSSSAMVYMKDAERAAELSKNKGFRAGLHINFIENYSAAGVSNENAIRQNRISLYLKKRKMNTLIYNPTIKRDFEYVFKSQYEEFLRLYGANPTHIDGHHHMHLCMNMLFGNIIPPGLKVRRSLSFFRYEKSIIKRGLRFLINKRLRKLYICTDYCFDIAPITNRKRLQEIFMLARHRNVEIMVHPERRSEKRFLMSSFFKNEIKHLNLNSFEVLAAQ